MYFWIIARRSLATPGDVARPVVRQYSLPSAIVNGFSVSLSLFMTLLGWWIF